MARGMELAMAGLPCGGSFGQGRRRCHKSVRNT